MFPGFEVSDIRRRLPDILNPHCKPKTAVIQCAGKNIERRRSDHVKHMSPGVALLLCGASPLDTDTNRVLPNSCNHFLMVLGVIKSSELLHIYYKWWLYHMQRVSKCSREIVLCLNYKKNIEMRFTVYLSLVWLYYNTGVCACIQILYIDHRKRKCHT